MPQPKAFLHVGTRKSGTTYLQHALLSSREALKHDGVHVAALTRTDFKDLVPRLRRWGKSGNQQAGRRALAHLAELLAPEAPQQVVSLEALAELPGFVADEVVAAVADAGFEVEVVLTARHVGLAIPSEWQQRVKQRGVQSYADFVASVRRGEDALFSARHDLAGVARR